MYDFNLRTVNIFAKANCETNPRATLSNIKTILLFFLLQLIYFAVKYHSEKEKEMILGNNCLQPLT